MTGEEIFQTEGEGLYEPLSVIQKLIDNPYSLTYREGGERDREDSSGSLRKKNESDGLGMKMIKETPDKTSEKKRKKIRLVYTPAPPTYL